MTVRTFRNLLSVLVLLVAVVPVAVAADVAPSADEPVAPAVTEVPTTEPAPPTTIEVPPTTEAPPPPVVEPLPPPVTEPPTDEAEAPQTATADPGAEPESVIETGYLEIVKVEKGGHAPDTPGTYTIAWDGPGDADGQVDVTAGTTAVVGPLPLGDYVLSEVDPPEGVAVTIAPNPVTVIAGDAAAAAQVTVTNRFPDADPAGVVDAPVGPPERVVASDSVTTGPESLPRTGATTLPLLLAGVALLAVGALLTGGRRLLEHRTR